MDEVVIPIKLVVEVVYLKREVVEISERKVKKLHEEMLPDSSEPMFKGKRLKLTRDQKKYLKQHSLHDFYSKYPKFEGYHKKMYAQKWNLIHEKAVEADDHV